MKIEVRNRCSDFSSYRAARVKSLFNAESGCNFNLTADLPIDDDAWKIGMVVGPSGSGKSSIGRSIWPEVGMNDPQWPAHRPIIDVIAPRGDFNEVTGALAAVGLGSVPAWLRPHSVLSNGEKFRADLARVICERPARVKIDEFTSVVDRQIARFGAMAFAKAWRRGGGQAVLISCHYDVIDWIEPDWVFDTATGKYAGRGLWRRPTFEFETWQTDWRYWPLFEPHYYLKLPHMVAATNFVATVEGELVAHVAFAPSPGLIEARASRLVVMPEWQGAGIGLRFLNGLCERWMARKNPYRRRMSTVFHTSHPGLCEALRRHASWTQVSAALHGDNRQRSAQSLAKSGYGTGSGFGGHFRAVQGFRFWRVT
jgi:GNAT superfamily N-acetyltransferase